MRLESLSRGLSRGWSTSAGMSVRVEISVGLSVGSSWSSSSGLELLLVDEAASSDSAFLALDWLACHSDRKGAAIKGNSHRTTTLLSLDDGVEYDVGEYTYCRLTISKTVTSSSWVPFRDSWAQCFIEEGTM